MTSGVLQIGFDRFIRLDWVTAAVKYRAGLASLDDFNQLLDDVGFGVAAKKKTRTVLNRLWLEPRAELTDFASRGVEIYKSNPNTPIAALSWGMAIATYPFFGRVAELTGRLSALQGDCASSEVHRRMSEIYGEREGTSRMTNMVLQSQADWGAIERVENGKRLIRSTPIVLSDDQIIVWLAEAAIRYTGKAIAVSNLKSMPVLYPFVMEEPITYFVSNCPTLELRSEGTNNQFVALRDSL
ncbi:MAG: hypothetical protein NTX38_05340 [Methylobacter sp.]|nr:hypothetical protein [Methylobacter sp.]